MILLVRGAKAATSEHSFGPYKLGIKLKSVYYQEMLGQ